MGASILTVNYNNSIATCILILVNSMLLYIIDILVKVNYMHDIVQCASRLSQPLTSLTTR